MAMAKNELRWVPPAGWPVPPEGWSPSPGWRPDPAWPPAPDDWEWWQVTDRTRLSGERELIPQGAAAPIDEAVVASLVGATQTLTEDLKKGISEVSRLRAAVSKAAKPKKLRAIGSVKRVVLYETEVKLYGQLVPLSPSLRATAMTAGTKRDRVFAQDEDRRELTLSVDWPGGSRTVHWERNEKSVLGAMVTPAELHNMAAAINTAAVHSPEVKSRLATASTTHRQALAEGCARARATIERDLGTLRDARDSVVRAMGSVIPDKEKGMPRPERAKFKTARRALNKAQGLDGEAAAFLQSLEVQRPPRRAELEKHDWPMTGFLQKESTASDAGREEPGDDGGPSGAGDIPNSDIDLLERLARLHEQGAVSAEEFAAKKAEILGRL